MSMSASQALKKYRVDLIEHLPLENVMFFAMANCANLFPLGIDHDINAEPTRAKKVSCFLDFIDAGADIYLPKLLEIMKNCGAADVEQLAKKIAATMDGESNKLTQTSSV